MSKEIFIKNKIRQERENVIREPYQPEYIRLNREPVIMGVKKEDFMPKVPKRVKVREVDVGPGREPTEVLQNPPTLIPKQIKVNSGQNEETLWNKHIAYDEIQLPPELEKYEEIEIDDKPNSSAVVSINVGEYVLFYNDSLIMTGTLDEISSNIEALLLDDENDVELDKFSVFKKMNIKTGVLVTE